ncbi:hypothetical protein [Psychroserpens sp. MEBiC05023]
MNTTVKKIIKGTLAIFAIKLVIVGGLFVFQSCQSESVNSTNEVVKANFMDALIVSNQNLNNVAISYPENTKNDNILARDMQGATETVCLMEYESNSDTIVDIEDNINTVSEIILAKTNYNLITQFDLIDETENESNETESDSDTNFIPEDCVAIIEIPIQPVVDALEPTIQYAKDYLYSNGFNDSDIEEVLDSNNEGYLVGLVSLMISTDTAEDYTYFDNNSFNFVLGAQTLHAQNWSKIGGCAKKAFGLDLIDDFRNWKSLKKKARKKLVKKALATMGAKYVGGWFGAAVIATEFALCMA